jgi:8-oxo-dGTP pyrophosphatase MutT (NUDIX family)
MTREKSCGAVVYKIENDDIRILVEKMKLGHYSIPKGHVENNETEIETALREIKEETNLDVIIDTGFRKVITYSPYEGAVKDVVFFVAEMTRGEPVHQESEVSDLLFLDETNALQILTFDSDKEVVRAACQYIRHKNTK